MNIEIFHYIVHVLTGIIIVMLVISNILIYRRTTLTQDYVDYLENDLNALAHMVKDIRNEAP